MKQGSIQVYYGDGRGKTTAAIGQGIRAVGENLKVIMIQFLNICEAGECITLSKLEPDFKVFKFEKRRSTVLDLEESEKKDLMNEMKNAVNFARKVLDTGECDVFILDNILDAVEMNFVTQSELLNLIDHKPEYMKLIMTGRALIPEVIIRSQYIYRILAEKEADL